jgi:hypothetical protein
MAAGLPDYETKTRCGGSFLLHFENAVSRMCGYWTRLIIVSLRLSTLYT